MIVYRASGKPSDVFDCTCRETYTGHKADAWQMRGSRHMSASVNCVTTMATKYDKPPHPCPECGGERVWARATHQGGFRPEGRSVFSGAITASRAAVCTSCGAATLYVDEPTIFGRQQS
jgi:predicted RNA-binding Zn-ribbon protein involved in translation (DUF1610 family)